MNEVQFPTITVGDRTLTVRFSVATQVLLSRYGIDPRKLSDALSPNLLTEEVDAKGSRKVLLVDDKPVPNPDYMLNTMILFACTVAENYIEDSIPDKCELSGFPTPAYWTKNIHPLQFEEVVRVINEAVGKVTEARIKSRLAAVPPPAAQPTAIAS